MNPDVIAQLKQDLRDHSDHFDMRDWAQQGSTVIQPYEADLNECGTTLCMGGFVAWRQQVTLNKALMLIGAVFHHHPLFYVHTWGDIADDWDSLPRETQVEIACVALDTFVEFPNMFDFEREIAGAIASYREATC